MKIRIAVLFILSMVVCVFQVLSQEEAHGREVQEIINEIKQNQAAQSLTEINPDQVRPSLLEELGDSVMGLMLADEEQHEWMDRMMGGEGSDQLDAMHRWMGYSYLQNNGNLSQMDWGPGMMRGWNRSRNRGLGQMGPGMMGNWYGHGRWWTKPWIWIIVILIIAAITIVLVLVLTRNRRPGNEGKDEALTILKLRYARGEISREEYERMREDLK